MRALPSMNSAREAAPSIECETTGRTDSISGGDPERTATLGIVRGEDREPPAFLWDPVGDIFYHLPRSSVVCGKDPACGIRLEHATVSRRHARIERMATGWRILDLASRNGVFLRGERILREGEACMHDVLMLGGQPLVIVPEPAPAAMQRAHASFHTRSAELCRELETARKAAATASPVLIGGATGTGKEWMSRFIHEHSGRRGQMVALNCGALSRELLESELFGHVRGAFTGADGARMGLVAQAAGGTLFLDEIAEMLPGQQAALLRFLENRTYRPVGADREQRSDARIVAATHADLHQLASRGIFRPDLLYRLMEIRLELPPLARRKSDFPLLLRCFEAPDTGPREWGRLLAHDWPGNLRELRHVCTQARWFGWKRALSELERNTPISAEKAGEPAVVPESPAQIRDLERRMIQQTLQRCGRNTSAAARELGLPRSTLVNRMRALGMP